MKECYMCLRQNDSVHEYLLKSNDNNDEMYSRYDLCSLCLGKIITSMDAVRKYYLAKRWK